MSNWVKTVILLFVYLLHVHWFSFINRGCARAPPILNLYLFTPALEKPCPNTLARKSVGDEFK